MMVNANELQMRFIRILRAVENHFQTISEEKILC